MKPGLDILNTGKGHMEINFDTGDVQELLRAKKIVTDMLKSGYLLFVHDDNDGLVPVKAFDEEKGRYIIQDGSAVAASTPVKLTKAGKPDKRRGRKASRASVPMNRVRATAMGRSAGG